MSNNRVILRCSNIHKNYRMGRSSTLHVLKGIDLNICEGEIVAVIGPSGVGKSTLLHIIGALDRPSEGKVELDGVDIFSYDDLRLAKLRNKTIGFVFQFHHLLPEFTALENVMLPGMIAGDSKNKLLERAQSLLSEVGLQERAHHRPSELSGGEQQRVAVARALINQPRLILADEPSGNLDVHTAESLHQLIWQLSRQHRQTFVIVTHNRELAERSHRVVELYDGQIKSITTNCFE